MVAEVNVPLDCPHCGYQWKSASKSDRVCCPKCKKSFKKREKKK